MCTRYPAYAEVVSGLKFNLNRLKTELGHRAAIAGVELRRSRLQVVRYFAHRNPRLDRPESVGVFWRAATR